MLPHRAVWIFRHLSRRKAQDRHYNIQKTAKLPNSVSNSSPELYENHTFFRIQIESLPEGFKFHQQKYLTTINTLNPSSKFNDFASTLQLLTWITQTKPELSVVIRIFSKLTERSFVPANIKRNKKPKSHQPRTTTRLN